MSRLFDSYIIADWSAASKPASGADSIWIGALSPDARLKLQFQSSNPDTRAKAYEQLVAAIERLIRRGDRVLLGFDFPIGYPAGTSNALQLNSETLAPWQLMHDFLSQNLKDKPDNNNNRFALAARMNRLISGEAFPFWGCPRKDVISTLSDKKPRAHQPDEPAEYRLCEQTALAAKTGRPQSVWKLAYVGAAGGQAFTGIPVIQKLKSHFQDKLAIWPMETGWIEHEDQLPQIMVAEVYPSIITESVPKGRIKDEFQVESLAKWLADSDSNSRLRGMLNRPDKVDLPDSERILAEEGWILGI